MEDYCDICGDIGVADAIITCSQCKINSEHMYCMRTLLEEPVDDWVCQECESSSKPNPPASPVLGELPSVGVGKGHELRAESRKLPNESRVASANWEKKVETGKTKYISVNEAIMLSSGEKKSSAPLNFTWRSKPKQPKIGGNVFERTAIRRKTVPLSFSSQQDLASGPSRPPKLHRLRNMEISERQLQHSTKLTEVPRSVSSLQPSQAPKNGHMQKELPRDIQWAQTKARRLVRKQLSTPSLKAPPLTISGGNSHTSNEPRISDAENINNNVLPDIEKCSCSPAFDAFWKGSFSIQDDHRHGGLNHQIQAHPPSRVRKKIYEFSKKMPEVLHFQLVPVSTFWINLFKEGSPDDRDIALYFFPSVGERSEDYIILLDSISLRNLALREQIADVELLVFTSKLLPVNYQCWDGKFFLWGVFRRLKRDTTGCLDNQALELSVQPLADAIDAHNQVDDHEDVDMDIDMIGGTSVGKVDVPVQKKSLRGVCTSFSEASTAAVALPGPHQPITSVSRRVFDPVTAAPLLNCKTELHDLIPPGFEEVFKLRIMGSSSLDKNMVVEKGKGENQSNDDRSFPAKCKVEI